MWKNEPAGGKAFNPGYANAPMEQAILMQPSFFYFLNF
uniref:Uncharacterized protein n=1 Tax=Rhizophora mucronata TaxID=61149 RepID=A0A2P2N9X6_RHIMU